jgi:hypothetical protein
LLVQLNETDSQTATHDANKSIFSHSEDASKKVRKEMNWKCLLLLWRFQLYTHITAISSIISDSRGE